MHDTISTIAPRTNFAQSQEKHQLIFFMKRSSPSLCLSPNLRLDMQHRHPRMTRRWDMTHHPKKVVFMHRSSLVARAGNREITQIGHVAGATEVVIYMRTSLQGQQAQTQHRSVHTRPGRQTLRQFIVPLRRWVIYARRLKGGQGKSSLYNRPPPLPLVPNNPLSPFAIKIRRLPPDGNASLVKALRAKCFSIVLRALPSAPSSFSYFLHSKFVFALQRKSVHMYSHAQSDNSSTAS
ncbi:hypothetical protein PUMCH_001415 [Australozyma saopauloensis]|uniref:Uncharacterized protein n=1 Tax=Australozyma saopauloensis TaxID=291208 RepID=A0AAX4H6S0_9ASCO|nr:hypothetical protein PUMCH_001415 [[Candida] saopauloensis]